MAAHLDLFGAGAVAAILAEASMADDLLTQRGTMKMVPGAPLPGITPHPHLRVVPTERLPDYAGPVALVAPPPPEAIHHTTRAPEQVRTLEPGDRIGPYLVVGFLGEGGLSYVHEVRHVHLGQTFALKWLNERALERPKLVDRFIGEGKILAYLSSHPRVVRVHEVGKDARIGPFVVMEKLEGKSLRAVLGEILQKGERMHPQVALYIAIQIAQALHEIHEVAIIHRDLKPENIQIVPRTTGTGFDVKIIDWGASLSGFTAATSVSDPVIATAPYMSPEQAKRQRVTAASDQYSLAHMIWELLMGRHAFQDAMEDSPGRHDLVMGWQIFVDIRVLPATVAARGLAMAVARALSKDPRERFPSMQAFANELVKYVEKGKTDTPISVPAPAGAKPYRPTALSAYRKPGLREKAPAPAPVHEVRSPKMAVAVTEITTEPTFVVLVPPALRGIRILLGEEGVIGSQAEQADLIFDHHTVSTRHARYRCVIQDDDRPVYAIEDLDSLNGCFVGSFKTISEGMMPVQGVAPIKAYDVIGFGDVVAMLMPAGGFQTSDMAGFAPRRPREEGELPMEPPPPSRERAQPQTSRWLLLVIALSILVIVYFGAAMALQSFAGISIPPLRP